MSRIHDPTKFATMPVGRVAAVVPGAAAIFLRHGVDFCCGGEQSLAEAAAARDLDLQGMIVSLAEMPDAMDDAWFDAETASLIAHIRARYHDVHLRELPWLIRLAGKVEAVHKDNPAVPRGLTDLLARISAEIRVHQQREEVILFPMMLRGGGTMIASAIATMRAEHDDHGTALAQIDRLSHGRTAPAGACSTWKALCVGLTKFHDDLTMHVHLENNILFPRFAGEPAEEQSAAPTA